MYGRAQSKADTATIKYIGTFQNVDQCQSALKSSPKGPFETFTFHTPGFGGDFAGQCFGSTTDDWAPTPQALVTSGYLDNQNTWVAHIPGQVNRLG